MRNQARVIPVDGISEITGVNEGLDHEVTDAEAQRQKRELLLLNVATGLSVMLVSCAWIMIALD